MALSAAHRPSAAVYTATPINPVRSNFGHSGRALWDTNARRPRCTTGLQCKNCAVRPHGVCWQHGAKAIRASKAIAARPYNAVETVGRKAKRQRHQDYARLRAAGRAPPPQKESLSRQTSRRAREERVEHSVAVLKGRAMPDLEREFREHHARRPQRLPALYEC